MHPGGFEPPTARFVAEYSIQLSYGWVHPGGFEPPTARFVAEYSIQLSYGCIGKLTLLQILIPRESRIK